MKKVTRQKAISKWCINAYEGKSVNNWWWGIHSKGFFTFAHCHSKVHRKLWLYWDTKNVLSENGISQCRFLAGQKRPCSKNRLYTTICSKTNVSNAKALEALLPWEKELPDICKKPRRWKAASLYSVAYGLTLTGVQSETAIIERYFLVHCSPTCPLSALRSSHYWLPRKIRYCWLARPSQTGFAPVRLIALCWAHNWNFSFQQECNDAFTYRFVLIIVNIMRAV